MRAGAVTLTAVSSQELQLNVPSCQEPPGAVFDHKSTEGLELLLVKKVNFSMITEKIVV